MLFHDIRGLMIQFSYNDLKAELLFMLLEFLGMKTPGFLRKFAYSCEHAREKEERKQEADPSVEVLKELLRLNRLVSFGFQDAIHPTLAQNEPTLGDFIDLSNVRFSLEEGNIKLMKEVRDKRSKFDFAAVGFSNSAISAEKIRLIRYRLNPYCLGCLPRLLIDLIVCRNVLEFAKSKYTAEDLHRLNIIELFFEASIAENPNADKVNEESGKEKPKEKEKGGATAASGPSQMERVRNYAKNLLAKDSMNVELWDAYAKIEKFLGNEKESKRVYDKALSMAQAFTDQGIDYCFLSLPFFQSDYLILEPSNISLFLAAKIQLPLLVRSFLEMEFSNRDSPNLREHLLNIILLLTEGSYTSLSKSKAKPFDIVTPAKLAKAKKVISFLSFF